MSERVWSKRDKGWMQPKEQLVFRCPRCGVRSGEPCIAPNGVQLSFVHSARRSTTC